MAKVETRQKRPTREGTKQPVDIKGKLVEFLWFLKKKGYRSAKNRFKLIRRLVDLGADLWNPESVRELLASDNETQMNWSNGYKMLICYAYENFLEMEELEWERPVYKQEETLPFIPLEEELDELIAAVGKTVGTFLQGLKDTGVDPGELAKLKWTDINYKNRTANITPVKGHKPRILRISRKFLERAENLPKNHGEHIFGYVSIRSSFQKARRNAARRLGNPRLNKITFTTFRHWKGTMEYHRTKDILHVKNLLGHKRIENTMKYINLEQTMFDDRPDDFHARVANNVKEAVKLVKAGFNYVTGEYEDGGKIFRKRR